MKVCDYACNHAHHLESKCHFCFFLHWPCHLRYKTDHPPHPHTIHQCLKIILEIHIQSEYKPQLHSYEYEKCQGSFEYEMQIFTQCSCQ